MFGAGEGAEGARGFVVGVVMGVGADGSEEVVPSPLHPQKVDNSVDVGGKQFSSSSTFPEAQGSIIEGNKFELIWYILPRVSIHEYQQWNLNRDLGWATQSSWTVCKTLRMFTLEWTTSCVCLVFMANIFC